MNILIGVCGIGNGHSLRQFEIISQLKQDNKIAIFGFDRSYKFIKNSFKDIPVFKVFVPWIESAIDGIDYELTASNKHNYTLEQIPLNFKAMYQAKQFFNGIPDLVFSDYEPISAQFAYATNTTLITIDQQSKFLGYKFPDFDSFTRLEEKARLSLFFPKVFKRYSTSFFMVPFNNDNDYHVEILPPIIRKDVLELKRAETKTNIILVYLSPYGKTEQSLDEIISLLKERNAYQFIIFNHNKINIQESSNIDCYLFDRDKFTSFLEKTDAVITTAGHTLLSELIYLKIPVFSIPLNTYDQHYCSKFINDNMFGIGSSKIDKFNLTRFLENIDTYKINIENSGNIFSKVNGVETFMSELKRFKII